MLLAKSVTSQTAACLFLATRLAGPSMASAATHLQAGSCLTSVPPSSPAEALRLRQSITQSDQNQSQLQLESFWDAHPWCAHSDERPRC